MGSDQLFYQNKIRNAKELARQKAKKSPYETVLIVCEDEKSSVNYFKFLRQEYRLNTTNVKVVPSKKGSAPISVVEYAIETGDATPGIDKVYCVFDRDEHSSYQKALDKINHHKPKQNAKNKPKYKAIVSSPCFELWLLLHFTYTTKPYFQTDNKSSCENLTTELRKHLPEYAKNSNHCFPELVKHSEVAIKNAMKLKAENETTGSMNPATDVYELVEFLMKLMKKN